MATKIVLNKKNSKDDYGILGIQSFDGGKTKKSLGIRMTVEHYKMYYNKDFKQFKPNTDIDYLDINNKIIDAIYRFENNLPDTTKLIEKKPIVLNKENNKDVRLSFITYFESRMALKKTEGHRYGVLNILRKLKKYLKYIGVDDLYFDEFDTDFVIKFKNYCLTVPDPKKLTESGVKNYFTILKSVYHDAQNSGYYYFKINPFALVKNENVVRKEKNPLNINQVKALMELELEGKYNLTRKMFYFAILSNGMRCSDLMFLRYEDFQQGRLSYQMMKTGSELKILVGIKTMLILAELLGELDKYRKYIETVKYYDKEIKGSYTIAELEVQIAERCPQIGFVEGSDYEGYKGYTIKKKDYTAMKFIDAKIELATGINNMFVDDMQEIINKQDGKKFVFLDLFSKKAGIYFKDYVKGDVLTFEQFQKYKALRNLYNIRLYKINEIYNSSIPLRMKERWKYTIHLSSHVARNTFVNILLKEKVDVYIISNSLAHTELKTTQNYINSGFNIDASDSGTIIIQDVI